MEGVYRRCFLKKKTEEESDFLFTSLFRCTKACLTSHLRQPCHRCVNDRIHRHLFSSILFTYEHSMGTHDSLMLYSSVAESSCSATEEATIFTLSWRGQGLILCITTGTLSSQKACRARASTVELEQRNCRKSRAHVSSCPFLASSARPQNSTIVHAFPSSLRD